MQKSYHIYTQLHTVRWSHLSRLLILCSSIRNAVVNNTGGAPYTEFVAPAKFTSTSGAVLTSSQVNETKVVHMCTYTWATTRRNFHLQTAIQSENIQTTFQRIFGIKKNSKQQKNDAYI